MASTLTVSEQTERIIFLDKIRYTMVLGVVILHVACAYATIIPWWSVLDGKGLQIFDLIIFILDIYQMPVLFFLAGYFGLSSLQRYGLGGFVIAKLKRLGLPLLWVGLFMISTIPYIGYARRTAYAMGFFEFWWMQMKTAVDLHWVHIATVEIAARHALDYSQWHLWFISLLLIFFLLTALWAKLFPGQWPVTTSAEARESRSVLYNLLVAGCLCAAGMCLVHRVSPDWTWAKVGGFILVQPTRLPIYAGFFILGLFARSNKWFSLRPIPVHPWIWLGGSLIMLILLLGATRAIGFRPAPIPWGLSILHSTLRVFAALGFLCFFLAAGQRWWQRPTPMWRRMHPISYDIYLIHLPIVVVLQLIASYLPLPVGVKFVMVGIVSVGVSWGLGRLIVTPYPVLAVGLLLAGFGIISLVW